jgi:hypothetical protein
VPTIRPKHKHHKHKHRNRAREDKERSSSHQRPRSRADMSQPPVHHHQSAVEKPVSLTPDLSQPNPPFFIFSAYTVTSRDKVLLIKIKSLKQ